jgi:serine/threonine protein kinase
MPGPVDRPLQPHALPAGFEFVRVLGVGADGWVCLAKDLALERLVAVKTVLGGALVPGGSARLAREARVLAALRHPNVVRVHRLVELGPDVALCEEFVDGPSLAEALGDPSHELFTDGAARLRLLAEVAEALQHCAQRGVVHRDLKPGNVLLTSNGSAKVADFGLARLSHAAAAFRTSPGVVSGTPGYLAPEQVRDPDHEHLATDYYSFAVVSLECLTGQRLGAAQPDQLLDLVPEELRPAFRAGLSDDPAVRWPPGRLLDAVLASGWSGRPRRAVGHWSAGPAPGQDPTTTVGTSMSVESGARESVARELRRSPQRSSADAAPEPEHSGPGRLVEPGAVPWVPPTMVPLQERSPWSRRHPLAVGLTTGVILVVITLVVFQVVIR